MIYTLILGARAILDDGPLYLLVPALWGEVLHSLTDFLFHLWPVIAAFLLLVAMLEFELARRRGTAPRTNAEKDPPTMAPILDRYEAI